MMLLASISWFGLLVLVLGGWLVFRLAGGRRGHSRIGGLKLLGIAAIVAGIAVFWIPRRHAQVDYSRPATVTVIDNDLIGEIPELDQWVGREIQVRHNIRQEGPPRWVFISLGTGLIILGALMFGRGGNRPVALKAVTLLGIGAILYAVVTFLGQAPRRASTSPSVSMVRAEKRDVPRKIKREDRPERRHSRHSHAKRPTLRPVRPADGEARSIDELPPRAGEIPVWAELARQAAKDESQEETQRESSSEPEPPAEPAGATDDEPKPEPQGPAAALDAEETADAAEAPAPATPPAEPLKAEKTSQPTKPAEPQGAVEPAEPPKPAEPQPAVEPAKPAPPKTELARLVEAQAAVAESADDVVAVGEEARPDWVDAPPGLSGGVYSVSVRSGRFATPPACQRELDREMKREADHYINEYLGEQAAALVDIPLSYLKNRVQKAEYVERVHSENLADLNLGQMYEIHALLEFDDSARADFQQQWRNAEVVNRLWYTGGAAAMVLALLATLYGYLKLDVRTDGAHKGRLQLAATLVALIAATGVLLCLAVPF